MTNLNIVKKEYNPIISQGICNYQGNQAPFLGRLVRDCNCDPKVPCPLDVRTIQGWEGETYYNCNLKKE